MTQSADNDADDMEERLALIESTCRDLIARIDRQEYNYGPAHVRSDLDYLLACAAPQGGVIPPEVTDA